MRSKFRLLTLALGISLLSGVISGNYFEITEYELFDLYSGKKIILKTADDSSDYRRSYQIYEIHSFNSEKAVVFSVLALGISLVGISFIKNKS